MHVNINVNDVKKKQMGEFMTSIRVKLLIYIVFVE